MCDARVRTETARVNIHPDVERNAVVRAHGSLSAKTLALALAKGVRSLCLNCVIGITPPFQSIKCTIALGFTDSRQLNFNLAARREI
jgi:hypothetical protein